MNCLVFAMLIAIMGCPFGIGAQTLPSGLFALHKAGEPIPQWLLNNADVSGVVIRQKWQDIEKAENQYDWSYLDRELDRVAKAGKQASLLLISGGVNTPQWLLDKKIDTFQFINDNAFHDTVGKLLSIPVYWDPIFVAAKINLIRTAGQRFTNQANLVLVSAACANSTTDDWNIPAAIADQANAKQPFSADKLVAVCKTIITETMQAFPKQIIRMAIGGIPKPLAEKPADAAIRVSEYGNSTYPKRFVIQRHNLFVKTPDPSKESRLEGWQLIKNAAPYSAAQMLWFAVDTNSCRLNAKAKPCDPRATLLRSAEIAKAYGISYLEVYGMDVMDKKLLPTIKQIASLFKSQSTMALQTMAEVLPSANLVNKEPEARLYVAENNGNLATSVSENHRLGQFSETTQWLNAPEHRLGSEGVEHDQFASKAIGQVVGYSIYLPKSYANGNQRYPVIYWLHGKNGNEARGAHFAGNLVRAVAQGLLKEAIMVFPNGGADSFYSDSYDSKIKVESMFINELIPLIDNTYRTLADRNGRVLVGFSMGGFGALKFYCKYPEKFAAVSTFGGAFLDSSNPLLRHDAHALQTMFNNDLAVFEKNTPAYWCSQHRDTLQRYGANIRIVVGSDDFTRRFNENMHNVLNSLGIEHEYRVLEGVRHIPDQYYDKDDAGSFKFIAQVLAK